MSIDYVEVGVVFRHSRADVWELLGDPNKYSLFFCGISSCHPLPRDGHWSTKDYVFRVSIDQIVLGYPVRTVASRTAEKLVLAAVDNTAVWVSITLAEHGTGHTRVTLGFFRPSQLEPLGLVRTRAEVTGWARNGLRRVDDYLAGQPTSSVANRDGALSVNIAKTVIRAGVVRASRPDRAYRQLASLAKWGFTIAGGYAAAAAREPEGLAVVDERARFTFAELHERTDRLAAALAAHGYRAGSTLGVLARNHAGLVQTMTACGKAGIDLVLLNTGLGRHQFENSVAEHGVRALIIDDEFLPLAHHLPDDIPRIAATGAGPDTTLSVDSLIAETGHEPVRPGKPGRLVVLTSGTTGAPRGAKRPTPKGFGTIAAMLSRMPLRQGERMLIAAPLFHSWGLAALQISTPLRATVVLRDRFDPEDCLRAIAEHECTSLIAVPLMLQRMLTLPPEVRERYDTASLQVVASSGSALDGALATAFQDTFGDVLYNFYGSTEVSWATVADPRDLRAAPTTAGTPPLGTTVSVLGEDGHPVPRGATGRIFVGNEMLFDGYTNGSTAPTARALMDTGDVGYLDANDRLFVSGRNDDMIISGGENVFPRPVEEALAALPQVAEVAVIGVPDDEFGERLAAFIVPTPGARLDADMVRGYLRHRLARSSVPRDVRFVGELPRSATGKILKRLLLHR